MSKEHAVEGPDLTPYVGVMRTMGASAVFAHMGDPTASERARAIIPMTDEERAGFLEGMRRIGAHLRSLEDPAAFEAYLARVNGVERSQHRTQPSYCG